MAPKIEVHVVPRSTAAPSYHTVKIWEVLAATLGIFLAILGYRLFSPSQFVATVTDAKLFHAYVENKQEAHEASLVAERLETIEQENLGGDSLRKWVAEQAGIPQVHAVEIPEEHADAASDLYGLGPAKYLNKIRKAHDQFRVLRDTMVANPSYAANLPILYPLKKHDLVTGRFEEVFDPRVGRPVPHPAVDFAAQVGDTVIAPGGAMVASVTQDRGYGLSITLLHNQRMESFYAHLERSLVSPGQVVRRGQAIGLVGSTGMSSGPHLHYELRFHDHRVNPEHYFITP